MTNNAAMGELQNTSQKNIFYAAYVVAIVEELLRHTVLSEYPLYKVFGYGSLALAIGVALCKLALDWCSGRIPFSAKAVCVAGTVLTCFFLFRGQSDAFFVMWPFVMASWDCDFRKLVKIAAITGMCTILLVCTLGYIGVLENATSIRYREDIERTRSTLGFLNVNHAPFFFFFMHLSWVYVRGEKLSVYEIISLEALEYLLFRQTDSRTSFYLTVPLTVVLILFKALPQLRQCHQKYAVIAACAPIVCTAVFLAVGMIDPNSGETLREINQLTSHRLSNNFDGLRKHGLSLFGSAVAWTDEPGKYDWVDNVYLYSLISYGVPFMLSFFAMIISLCRNAMRKTDTYMFLCLLAITLFGISENYCFRIECNPFYLFLAYHFSENSMMESARRKKA